MNIQWFTGLVINGSGDTKQDLLAAGKRLTCSIQGHETRWKHPQQTDVICERCGLLVNRADRWVDPE